MESDMRKKEAEEKAIAEIAGSSENNAISSSLPCKIPFQYMLFGELNLFEKKIVN